MQIFLVGMRRLTPMVTCRSSKAGAREPIGRSAPLEEQAANVERIGSP